MLCAPLVLHPRLTLQRGWATFSALRLCSDRSHMCLRHPRPMQEATVTQAAMRNSRRHLSELKDYKDPVTLEREFLSTTRQLRAKGLSDSQATSASKVPETDAGSGGTNRPISYTQTVSRKFHKYHHSGAYVSCWRPRCALCLCITCPAAERRAWLTVGSRVWSRCAGEEQVRGRRVRVVLLHGIQEERARVHCDDCEPGRVQLRQHQLTRRPGGHMLSPFVFCIFIKRANGTHQGQAALSRREQCALKRERTYDAPARHQLRSYTCDNVW